MKNSIFIKYVVGIKDLSFTMALKCFKKANGNITTRGMFIVQFNHINVGCRTKEVLLYYLVTNSFDSLQY